MGIRWILPSRIGRASVIGACRFLFHFSGLQAFTDDFVIHKKAHPKTIIITEPFKERLLRACADLQRCHLILRKISLDLLKLYSIPCVCALTHASLELTCTLYKTFSLPLVHNQELTFVVIFNGVKWVIVPLLKVLGLLAPLTYVADKVSWRC